MEHYLADHLPAGFDSSKRRHPGPQQTIRIINRHLNPVGRLIVLIAFAFGPDLGECALEGQIREGARFDANRLIGPISEDTAARLL